MKNLKKVLAVAVVSAFTQSAFAFWDTGVDTVNRTGVNDGEAILTLWDATAQKSYSQDLGIKYSQLFSGAAFNGQAVNLDATALSVFGGNFSEVMWNISAANSHTRNGTTNAYAGAGYIYSYQEALTKAVPNGIGTNVSTHWQTFNPYQNSLGMFNPAVAGNQVRTGTAAGSNETGYQSTWTDYITANPGASDFVSNSVMNLWFTGYGNAAGTQGAVANLGSVKLDLLTNKVVFQSEVPVPGAVWMMGSALLGLVGVGRSRKQRA
jgi:hypothetical protein